MPYRPRSTLEQWRILQAVIDAGGYAQAAEMLSKSQSSLNHAVAKLQTQLGVELLEVRGRKAYLTEHGEVMLRRSRLLTQQVEDLELLASNMTQGWEPEIRVAVELAYPRRFLNQALAAFYPLCRGSRIQLIDSVITGSTELIQQKKADLVIAAAAVIPKGYLGEPLCVTRFIPVTGSMNSLASTTQIDQNELSQHLQLVIRDTAQKPQENAGWLRAEQRWTVDNFAEAIEILQLGLGFCWVPDFLVTDAIAAGSLTQLNLSQSSERIAAISLVTPKEETLGPGSKQLRQLILAAHQKI
ncbi:LysR family transcriptional regulator [Rheinheimera maricola]|uniref:LysR family transcriptional regulator n=1 Tax=Rheinheimera maricola TaxID=2793282 RepID=A0ABS7XAZ0_9GAMM|nr:LysR family transcriptional regulator [Rheinheimera maricola]MBZ9612731.1 LysR family transcriptional regulator [Rheinheimera maricola]